MAQKRHQDNEKKLSFPTELLSAYNESVKKLRTSPRYQMLRGLQMAELLGRKKRTSKLFKEMNIENLIELGVQGLVKLKGLRSEDIRIIIDVLERFNIPAECHCKATGETSLIVSMPTNQDAEEAEKPDDGLLAIERSNTELELAETKQKLKRISSDLLSSKLLSDYWEADWPRAPFEESLSFKQFSDLDFETLIRKRSFNVQKMRTVTKALNKFIGEHDVRLKSNCQSNSNLSEKPFLASSSVSVQFEMGQLALPLITQNLVRYFEYQCSLYPNSSGVFKVFFAHLPLTLKAHEAAILALSVNDAPSLSRRLLQLTKEEFDAALLEAQAKLRQLFELSCPKVAASWRSSLSSAGIAEEDIFAPYFDSAFDEEFQRILFRCLLQSMGAAHPCFGTETFSEIWTINPEIAQLLLDSALRKSDSSSLDAQTLQRLLPAFPVNKIKRALKSMLE